MTQHLIEKISKAKAILILDHPFWSTLVCNRPLSLREDLPFPTAATDGKSIWLHPEFVEKSTVQELVFTLAHEVGHKMFDHMTRRGERNPRRWNMAGDYIINDILVDEKVGHPPKGVLIDPGLVREGKTTDGVYNLLDNKDDGEGQGPGGGDGQWDNVFDAPAQSEAERAQAEADTKIEVAQAAQAAKMCGKLSKGLERFVDQHLKGVVDWRSVLRRFVETRAKVDYSYARPKRRFVSQELYLPSLDGHAMGELFVAVDCSGSIDNLTLSRFSAEIAAIKQDVKPAKIHVVYFDSRVSHYECYEPDDELDIRAHGGGGTAFSPIFAFADERDIQPACCVVLTDLYCSDFGPAPDYPVLWVTIGSTDAPWGEVVEMKEGA